MRPFHAVAIHAHFYQPTRENPWLERVEPEDSAAPYHDWNARVTAECYAPNVAARRLDARGRIVDIVNNFVQISFDVGPTLLAWLARERPDVHRAILQADGESRRVRGHGNALAQAYGHAILPLCSRRDKVTHVRWGLADFRHRFGREAEGMWLPETAVDRETLAVLAEAGVRFTILAPGQAAAVREPGGDWRPAATGLDCRRAYRYETRGGRELALFFYDGPVSHAIAFEGLLASGDALAERLLAGLDSRREGQLVHVATDGETYGHHHRFGEMALAAACVRLRDSGAVQLTNYATFLAAHPPSAAVRVVEGSSWSCVHGVERWRRDCGCRAGRHPGWTQRWRAPLREALDWLRDALDPLYEAGAATYLKDPWEARDDYVAVVLDRSPAALAAFFARHGRRPLGRDAEVRALKWLELQRHRLLMYASCGWFFDELSGLETVQVLRHAARAVRLAADLDGERGLEAELMRRLAAAPSNDPALADGAGVWRRHVAPAAADLDRIAARYAAVASGGRDPADHAKPSAFRIERHGWACAATGAATLVAGRLRVTAGVTTETAEFDVAVLHEGGLDLHGAVRPAPDAVTPAETRGALFRAFARGDRVGVIRALGREFGGRSFEAEELGLDERRRLLAGAAEAALDRLASGIVAVDGERCRLLPALREAGMPVPSALAAAARHVLERTARRELRALARGGALEPGAGRLRALLAEAASLGVSLEPAAAWAARPLEAALVRAIETPGILAVDTVLGVLELARELGVGLDVWEAQNRAFGRWRAAPDAERARLAPLLEALAFAVP